jgi:hypothetical protein
MGLTHGRFNLKLLRPGTRQVFFGPLDDVDSGDDTWSPIYRESRYCAPCHEGTLFGIRVYTTYSEWLASPEGRQGKSCQACHMAPTGRMTNMAPGKGGIQRDPGTLANHRFVVGSRADMLRRALPLSAVLFRSPAGVKAEVKLRAEGTGHRMPTGFIDRHLVLVVEPFNGENRPVATKAGSVLPKATGPKLSGQPGRLYGRLLCDDQGRQPAPFWQADSDYKDTRLQSGQEDRLSFFFPAETRWVRLRLLYRRFWPEVAQAKSWPDNEIVIFDRKVEAR